MSFVQRGAQFGGLVRDSFPNNVARNNQETTELAGLPNHLVVPSFRDAMFDWARVVPTVTRDYSRRHELVYKKNKSGSVIANKVSIRLFGFLGTHNFDPYGNWDGDELSAARASKFLKLEPGCFPEQYAEQMEAIENIKYLIAKSLTGYREQRRVEKQDLFVQRRVFRKLEGHISKQNLLPSLSDNIEAKAQTISKKWVAEQGVDFGRKSDTGRIIQCDRLVFNHGDFVDVHVTFDIITASRGAYKSVVIHLSPSQVVRLARAEVFGRVNPSSGVNTPSAAIVASEAKLVFDVEGGTSEEEEPVGVRD